MSSRPPRPRVLPQVLQVNSLIQTQKSTELAAALLTVYVERAEDLPVSPATPSRPPPPPQALMLQCCGCIWNSEFRVPLPRAVVVLGWEEVAF